MHSHINIWVQRAVSSWNVRGVPKLLYTTRHLLLGRDIAQFELEDGIRLFLDPEDYFQCMMFYGRYSPEILEALEYFVRPGDAVADIGAHIGFFSAHLGRLVSPGGCVYSFEPDPRAFERLKLSVEANQMGCVKPLPVALSANEGEIEFFLSPQLGWSTAVRNTHLTDLRAIKVKTAPLDHLVTRGQVSPNLRLVKMDVEGLEVEVLKGMRRTLETVRPILIAEVNGRLLAAQGESCSSLLKLIESFGYQVYALEKKSKWFWHKRDQLAYKLTEEKDRLPSIITPLPKGGALFEGDVICVPTEQSQRVKEH